MWQDELLIMAAGHGNVDIVRRILAEPTGHMNRHNLGDVVLRKAILGRHDGVAAAVLEAGAAVDCHGLMYDTARFGNVACLKLVRTRNVA